MPNTQPTTPPQLAAQFASLFDRMAARGMLEDVQILARTAARDNTNKAVGRQLQMAGVIRAYVKVQGGATQVAREGDRNTETAQIQYQALPQYAAFLNNANFRQRRVRLTTGDTREWRILSWNQTDMYVAMTVTTGDLSDATGGVR